MVEKMLVDYAGHNVPTAPATEQKDAIRAAATIGQTEIAIAKPQGAEIVREYQKHETHLRHETRQRGTEGLLTGTLPQEVPPTHKATVY